MSPTIAGPTAALAGTPAGIQAQGVWMGRRQLFIRFAAEAETATMYTADALANEIAKSMARSKFHSICVGGRDPLANAEYMCAAFAKGTPLPVMLDCDGQRPAQIDQVKKVVGMVQVTLESATIGSDAAFQCALESIAHAASAKLDHAVVVIADERASDSVLLRIVEQVHGASDVTQMVIHPGPGVAVDRDRRWSTLLERAVAVHADVRFTLRLPPPTGLR